MSGSAGSTVWRTVGALTIVLLRSEGKDPRLSFLDPTSEIWQRFDDVNHRAVFFLSQAAARTVIAHVTAARSFASPRAARIDP